MKKTSFTHITQAYCFSKRSQSGVMYLCISHITQVYCFSKRSQSGVMYF